MKSSSQPLTIWMNRFALSAVLLLPQTLPALEHVVSPADLRKDIRAEAEVRQQNRAKVEQFISSTPVQKALKSARIDSAKVQKAIPLLSDEELARLAAQSEKARKDFAAGSLTNEQLTYIVIALAAAVLVLVLVVR